MHEYAYMALNMCDVKCLLFQNIFSGSSRELLQCFSFGRLSRIIFGRLKCVVLGRLKCHFPEIEISHFRDVKMLPFLGD